MITDDTLNKLNEIIHDNLLQTAAKLSACIEQELKVPRQNIKIEYVNGQHDISIKFLDSIKDVTISITFGED